MSQVSQAFTEVTGATVHYHSGVFNWKKNTVMGVVGFVGLTALVVGTLALLHAHHIMNVGPIGTIFSSPWPHVLLGVGGGLLLVDTLALIILAVKHHQTKKQMDEYLESASWDASPPYFGFHPDSVGFHPDSGSFFVRIKTPLPPKQAQVHVYANNRKPITISQLSSDEEIAPVWNKRGHFDED